MTQRAHKCSVTEPAKADKCHDFASRLQLAAAAQVELVIEQKAHEVVDAAMEERAGKRDAMRDAKLDAKPNKEYNKEYKKAKEQVWLGATQIASRCLRLPLTVPDDRCLAGAARVIRIRGW